MSKFGGNDYLLVLQEKVSEGNGGVLAPLAGRRSKQVVTDAAWSYVAAKGIPLHRRFSSRKSETYDAGSVRKIIDPNAGQFSPLRGLCLSAIGEFDKLFIFAHGSEHGVAWMAADDQDPSAILSSAAGNADKLAKLLKEFGLMKVGLITFKACQVGKGSFLDEFKMSLKLQGIAVGWLKGYTGYAQTWYDRPGRANKPYMKIYSDDDLKKEITDKRCKIVKGPGNLLQDFDYEGTNPTRRQYDPRRFAVDELFGFLDGD